ncbi:MAG: hypothetical protein DCC68_20610 [Planctomycetota bacterium]|nr:MAG: hypothetical protein DCC68_20610 [Planctomycetota bacterium]
MKRRKRKRHPELARQNPRRHSQVAHANADRGNVALAHEPQHPQIVARLVRHRRDLDDVRIERRHPRVDRFEIRRRLPEIVQADDPLRLAKPRNARRNVLFDVDVVGPFADRRPQQELPIRLGERPFAAVPLVSTLIMAGGDPEKAEQIRAKTNVNGGAIAIGHPTGATAARLVMTVMYELRRRRAAAGDTRPYYGLATLCGGIGEAEAVIVKVGD